MTPEGRIKAKLNRRLAPLVEQKRIWRFMPVQRGMGSQALDYILCVAGFFVTIETKRPGGKPTAQQNVTASVIAQAGGFVLIVSDDASLDVAMQLINGLLDRVAIEKAWRNL